jgi:hypothetical protein
MFRTAVIYERTWFPEDSAYTASFNMPIAILVTAQYQFGLWHNNLRLRCLTYMGKRPSNGVVAASANHTPCINYR